MRDFRQIYRADRHRKNLPLEGQEFVDCVSRDGLAPAPAPAPEVVEPDTSNCDIKGSINSEDVKIYHVPSGRDYGEHRLMSRRMSVSGVPLHGLRSLGRADGLEPRWSPRRGLHRAAELFTFDDRQPKPLSPAADIH